MNGRVPVVFGCAIDCGPPGETPWATLPDEEVPPVGLGSASLVGPVPAAGVDPAADGVGRAVGELTDCTVADGPPGPEVGGTVGVPEPIWIVPAELLVLFPPPT